MGEVRGVSKVARGIAFSEIPDAEATISLRGGVLKATRAHLDAVPVEVEALDFKPDFPLPAEKASELAARAGEAARNVPQEPDPSPEERDAAWQARLEEAVRQAKQEAYQEGYDAAEAALRAEVDAEKQTIKEDVTRLKQTWKEFAEKSETVLVNLAFAVAQAMLEGPLPQDVKAVSAQVLAQAIETLGDQAPVEVALNPQDLARLDSYGLIDDLKKLHPSLRWHPDPLLKPGDWVVQSPEAAIRYLKDEMMTQLKNRLGLLAAMRKKQESQDHTP